MSSKNLIDLRNKKPQRLEQPALSFSPPPRLGKRVSPVRARRRRIRFVVAFVILVLIGAAAYGVSWASYLPRYSVQSVSIAGAQQVPTALIYDYVETLLYDGTHPFLSKDNIFLYNPGAIAREVEGYFPRVASVSVTRQSMLATAVVVTVQERQAYALWCTDATQTDCYEMDNSGFIFAQAPSQTVQNASDSTSSPQASMATSTIVAAPQQSLQYVFQGGIATSTTATSMDSTSSPQASSPQATATPVSPIGQTYAGSHMPGIIALLELLGQAGFSPAGAIVENGQDFRVPLSQGFYIKASFGEDPQDLVSNLQLVLSSSALQGKESQLEYVDLRFGDRVYYKLQGQGETQTQS